jgi:hypothetical protein
MLSPSMAIRLQLMPSQAATLRHSAATSRKICSLRARQDRLAAIKLSDKPVVRPLERGTHQQTEADFSFPIRVY